MDNKFKYDVFISFAHEDEQKVHSIYQRMEEEFGLRVFWSVRKLPKGVGFPFELDKALKESQHFALYCTEAAVDSDWVRQEYETFLNSYHIKDKDNRRMYVLLDPECSPKLVPDILQTLNRPNSTDELIAALVRALKRDFEQIMAEQSEEISSLQGQLKKEKQKAEEAQDYYRYNRFWGPIAKNREVHIVTCGRDVTHKPDSSRGYGGRTNIDMWDYRAVLDITHFFASNYPNTKITIEDPVSKLHGLDLEEAPRLADRIAHMRSMLEDKDCIIIGSPDVSDFAEIVLAKIHQIDPYTEGRVKKKGFVIIKERKYTKSSCYWEKEEKEKEGVAQILGVNDYQPFPHDLVKDNGGRGKMHGILIVANNPFFKNYPDRKIIILSGFSGVATNAIAKILTDEQYLSEFFELDNAYANTNKNIEALIGVEYIVDKNFENRDTRRISTISFERLVEI